MCPPPYRRKECTRGSRRPAEATTRQSTNLLPCLPRAPPHRAGCLAAASSPYWTAHIRGPARQASRLGTSRNLPDEPAALPASPGPSREASPCFVCPRETPPRDPQLYHSGFQAQMPQGTGRRRGGTATSSPSMTWRGPRRPTWTRASGCPPRTSLWSLPIRRPVGSAAPWRQPSPLKDAAATGQSPRVSEKDCCPLGVG